MLIMMTVDAAVPHIFDLRSVSKKEYALYLLVSQDSAASRRSMTSRDIVSVLEVISQKLPIFHVSEGSIVNEECLRRNVLLIPEFVVGG